METLRFKCPKCAASLEVPTELQGKEGACPECQAVITIPFQIGKPKDAPASTGTPATPPPEVPPVQQQLGLWLVKPLGEDERGPYTAEELVRRMLGGEYPPSSSARPVNGGDWKSITSYNALTSIEVTKNKSKVESPSPIQKVGKSISSVLSADLSIENAASTTRATQSFVGGVLKRTSPITLAAVSIGITAIAILYLSAGVMDSSREASDRKQLAEQEAAQRHSSSFSSSNTSLHSGGASSSIYDGMIPPVLDKIAQLERQNQLLEQQAQSIEGSLRTIHGLVGYANRQAELSGQLAQIRGKQEEILNVMLPLLQERDKYYFNHAHHLYKTGNNEEAKVYFEKVFRSQGILDGTGKQAYEMWELLSR